MKTELTESERAFFERAKPEFEERLKRGEKPEAALKAAAAGVVKRDEELFLMLYGVGGGGKDAADFFKRSISALVYNGIRAAKA